MGIMYISSKYKTPLINFEQKQPEIKIPKNPQFEKYEKNAWKLKINEKERVFRSYIHLRTKSLEDLRRKTTTKFLDWIGRERKGQGEKSF